MHEHETLYKEAVVLTLIAVFSFTFYHRVEQHSLYIGFILLSLVFYLISSAEEKKSSKSKTLAEYFHHTSSFFLVSLFFFIGSYALLKFTDTTFLIALLAIAVIMFSTGFMRLLFSKLEK